MKIGNKIIGKSNSVFIVAELSGNHHQNFDRAVKTIRAMKDSGADAVKIQTYTPDTITIKSQRKEFRISQGTIWDGRTLYDLYNEAYTPWDWQPKLKKIANGLGLIFFSSPFDKTAVDFLENMSVSAYKIASFEITDIPLIKYIASKGKPIIISTGIATLHDIRLAIATCKKAGNANIALLKCTSAYPTPIDQVNLLTIPDMKRKFRIPIGLSDHTLGISIPIAAVAMGAVIVEKHFILDRTFGGPDSMFSLEPNEFKDMVARIREVESAKGTVTYRLTKNMKKSREHARSLFVVKNMLKGDIFTKINIRSIRPGYGLHPKHYEYVLGRRASRNLTIGTPLSLTHLI